MFDFAGIVVAGATSGYAGVIIDVDPLLEFMDVVVFNCGMLRVFYINSIA